MNTLILLAALGAALPLRLTLEEAVQRGLETSHRIAEAVARGDAAEAAAGGRHASTLPQIAALAGYTRTNHVDAFGILLPTNQLRVIYPDVPDNYRTRLDLQWPIYTGGRLDALERAARIEATASADDIATARRDLTLDLTDATAISIDGQQSGASKLQPGSDVRASYQMVDGRAKALKLEVRSNAQGQEEKPAMNEAPAQSPTNENESAPAPR